MRTFRRLLPRVAAAAAALALAVLVPAGVASAHASVVSSQPADGAVLPSTPEQLSIRFDERVDPKLASLTLTGQDGSTIPLGALTVGGSGSELVAALTDALADGVYRIAYKVRDPLDLHLTAGTIVFGVGKVSVAVGGGEARGAPRPVDIALRWLERVGLALALGGAVLVLVVLPGLGPEVAATRRTLGLVTIGAAVQIVALVGLFVREAVDIGSPLLGTAGRLLSSSSFGRRMIAETVVAAALGATARLLRPLVDEPLLERWRARRFGELGWALGVMALAAAFLVSLAGHASTGGSYAVGVAVRVVHLLGMGAWAGGLAGIVLLRRHVRRPAALVAAFSGVALVATAALVASGLLLTGREVATVTALLVSWFGRLLLAKLAVLAVAAVWGARHARAVAAGRPVRTSGLCAEAVLAVVVVAGGAALSTTSPAVGTYYKPQPPASASAPAQTIGGDVVFKLSVRPNRPGANLVTATVASSRRPEPAPIVGVTIDFRALGADAVPPSPAKAGAPQDGTVDFGEVTLPISGPYQVEVQIDRPGAAVGLSLFQWTVDPPVVPHADTVVSDARLSPVTTAGAAAAAAVGVALVVRRRRRGARVVPDDDPALV